MTEPRTWDVKDSKHIMRKWREVSEKEWRESADNRRVILYLGKKSKGVVFAVHNEPICAACVNGFPLEDACCKACKRPR